jgi:hypothetical protein
VQINHGFARAVLEGAVHGRVWVDRVQAPRVVHALHPYGMSLVWGEVSEQTVDALGEHLRVGRYRSHDEWLQFDPRMAPVDWDSVLGAVPGELRGEPGGPCVQRYVRANFRFNIQNFEAAQGGAVCPTDGCIRPMTAAEFNLPGVLVTPSAFWPHAGAFLASGGGWCVDQAGSIGAIAFAALRLDREIEIGVETLAGHRGKGMAFAACVAMIRSILADGYTPVWACRKENIASLALARRLGFSVTKEIAYYRLPGA